jgi:excisionase family DNA binding protein
MDAQAREASSTDGHQHVRALRGQELSTLGATAQHDRDNGQTAHTSRGRPEPGPAFRGVADRLLGPDELAAFLGVPLRTIYRWRSRREGPRGYRVGRHVRYRLAEVERWLEDHGDVF